MFRFLSDPQNRSFRNSVRRQSSASKQRLQLDFCCFCFFFSLCLAELGADRKNVSLGEYSASAFYDRISVVRLFPNSGQVAKSQMFVWSKGPENRMWPTWVETLFSKWPGYPIRRNSESCRLTNSNTILFSQFLSLLAHKWSRSWQLINFN